MCCCCNDVCPFYRIIVTLENFSCYKTCKVCHVYHEDCTAFVCAMAAIMPDGEVICTEGIMEGFIGYEIKGTNGFGYDPIFYLPEYGMTSAEITPEEKNAISHRGKALHKMQEELKKRIQG